jgi:hypothetical protein
LFREKDDREDTLPLAQHSDTLGRKNPKGISGQRLLHYTTPVVCPTRFVFSEKRGQLPHSACTLYSRAAATLEGFGVRPCRKIERPQLVVTVRGPYST